MDSDNNEAVFCLTDDQQWQISSRTCLNETDSLSHHTQNKTTTVQVRFKIKNISFKGTCIKYPFALFRSGISFQFFICIQGCIVKKAI